MSWEDEGGDHSDASTSQVMSKFASKPPDARGKARSILPHSLQKEPTLPTPGSWTSSVSKQKEFPHLASQSQALTTENRSEEISHFICRALSKENRKAMAQKPKLLQGSLWLFMSTGKTGMRKC